jgi:hypothetical protein
MVEDGDEEPHMSSPLLLTDQSFVVARSASRPFIPTDQSFVVASQVVRCRTVCFSTVYPD